MDLNEKLVTFRHPLKLGRQPKTARQFEKYFMKLGSVEQWSARYTHRDDGKFVIDGFILFAEKYGPALRLGYVHNVGNQPIRFRAAKRDATEGILKTANITFWPLVGRGASHLPEKDPRQNLVLKREDNAASATPSATQHRVATFATAMDGATSAAPLINSAALPSTSNTVAMALAKRKAPEPAHVDDYYESFKKVFQPINRTGLSSTSDGDRAPESAALTAVSSATSAQPPDVPSVSAKAPKREPHLA